MAATIRQIAEATGVSRGTVDRVLHNRPGVKPEIAELVRHAAAEMGFVPNKAGKILAAKKQPITIGFFLPSIGNPFFEDVVRGMRDAERELKDFGVSVLLEEIQGFSPQAHLDGIRRLVDAGCTALCVAAIDTQEIRTYVNRIIEQGTPVITVNTDLTDTNRLCYVGCDYNKGGSTAGGLLSTITKEALHILIVMGSFKMKGHNERMQGFLQKLDLKRIPYEVVGIFESQDNDELSYVRAQTMLQQNPQVNCVYMTAAGAYGVCRALREMALNKKPFIIATDDVPSTREMLRLGIIDFTVCQEPYQQGYRPVHILFDYFMADCKHKPSGFVTSTVIKIPENLE